MKLVDILFTRYWINLRSIRVHSGGLRLILQKIRISGHRNNKGYIGVGRERININLHIVGVDSRGIILMVADDVVYILFLLRVEYGIGILVMNLLTQTPLSLPVFIENAFTTEQLD